MLLSSAFLWQQDDGYVFCVGYEQFLYLQVRPESSKMY